MNRKLYYAGMTALWAFVGMSVFVGAVQAEGRQPDKDDLKISTTPIGSPFTRHLAADLNMDVRELVKFENRGFGHAETITIVLISTSSGKPLKVLGNRRLKEKISLEQMAKEAGLDYPALYKVAREMKEDIESRGDKDLPPAVFETPSPSPTPTSSISNSTTNKKEKKKSNESTSGGDDEL